MNRREVNSFFIYSVIISLYLCYSLGCYSYWSNFLLLYVISYYILGLFIIKEVTNSGLITIRNIFNIFGVLYGNFFIMECISSNVEIKENYYYSLILHYLAIISFNIFYNIANGNSQFFKKTDKYAINVKIFNYGLTALLGVSLAALYYIIFFKIGVVAYFMSSRSEQSLMRSDYSLLLFYPYTLPLISSASLYFYLKYKRKYNMVLFLISFTTIVFEAILSASRGSLLFVVLPAVFLLNRFGKISNKVTVLLGIVGFCLFGIWKSLYSEEIEVQYDSEFVTWYRICDKLFSDTNISPFWGKSYFDTLINLVIPVTHIEPLSEWYVRKYEFDVYSSGGGRGFPSVLEAYLNFNILGVIMVYGFYGILVKKINLKSDLGVLLYMVIIVSIYKLFRAPAYSFWKNIMWFQIYPILMLWWFSKIKVKHGFS